MSMREGERRKLNVLEALIIACLLSLGGMILWMRDSIVTLNATLATLQIQMVNVPAISERVSRAEVRIEALEEGQKELRATKGLR